jgi:hypothetical protein
MSLMRAPSPALKAGMPNRRYESGPDMPTANVHDDYTLQ